MTIRLTYPRTAAGVAAGIMIGLFLSGVAYAVTSNVFRYSTTRTGWYSIHAAALSPEQSGRTYDISAIGDLVSSVGGCLVTGLNLPHGAELIQLQVWYQAIAVHHLQFYLGRKNLDSGTGNLFLLQYSSDSTSNHASQVFPITGHPLVDNSANAYSFAVCLSDSTDTFRGARITYRYRTAGD